MRPARVGFRPMFSMVMAEPGTYLLEARGGGRSARALVVVTEGAVTGSVASDIAARLTEQCFDWLEEPILRLGGEDIPIPVSPLLEQGAIPSATLIHDTALWLVTRKAPPWAA